MTSSTAVGWSLVADIGGRTTHPRGWFAPGRRGRATDRQPSAYDRWCATGSIRFSPSGSARRRTGPPDRRAGRPPLPVHLCCEAKVSVALSTTPDSEVDALDTE